MKRERSEPFSQATDKNWLVKNSLEQTYILNLKSNFDKWCSPSKIILCTVQEVSFWQRSKPLKEHK